MPLTIAGVERFDSLDRGVLRQSEYFAASFSRLCGMHRASANTASAKTEEWARSGGGGGGSGNGESGICTVDGGKGSRGLSGRRSQKEWTW